MNIWGAIKNALASKTNKFTKTTFSVLGSKGEKTSKSGLGSLIKNLTPGNKNVEAYAKIKEGLSKKQTEKASFKDLLKELLPGKNQAVENFAEVKEKLEEFKEIKKEEKNERVDILAREKINLASRYGTLGSQSRDKQRLFFQATQRLWEGEDPKKRYEAIIKKLGVKNIDEAYQLISDQDAFKQSLKELQETNEKEKKAKTEGWKGEGDEEYEGEKYTESMYALGLLDFERIKVTGRQ